MGNCVLKAFSPRAHDQTEIVKVVTSNGGIMQIPACAVTDQFPGQAIFRSDDVLASYPLRYNDEFHPNVLYHLLPRNPYRMPISTPSFNNGSGMCTPTTPYRMSSYDRSLRNNKKGTGGENEEFIKRSCKRNDGVWKVNLVISREELAEIFSESEKTKELIDSARTVAKCGGGNGGSSEGGSENSSVACSRRMQKSVVELFN